MELVERFELMAGTPMRKEAAAELPRAKGLMESQTYCAYNQTRECFLGLQCGLESSDTPQSGSAPGRSSNLTARKCIGIIARCACATTGELGGDKEGLCVIRIISKRTGKSTRLAVW